MLLSFAQFEREVTAERIRDKIAASKKKGMWMGGVPHLGYDIRDKKLVVNQAETQIVRHIFTRYLALGSVHALRDELAENGIVSKRRTSRHGRVTGGKPLARGALYRLLQNRIYRGEITHKGEHHPGKHQPIIDADLWDQVQAKLETNRVERKTGVKAKQPSLLAGLVYDDRGERLIPTHANKSGTRYRYYVSQSLIKQQRTEADTGWRIPAADLERLVEGRLTAFLASQTDMFDAIETSTDAIDEQKRLIEQAAALAGRWPDLEPSARRSLLQRVVHRIQVQPNEVRIHLKTTHLAEAVHADRKPKELPAAARDKTLVLTLTIAARLKRSGLANTFAIDTAAPKRPPDRSLLRLIAQAARYRKIVLKGQGKPIKTLAAEAGVSSSYFTRVFRLSFLAPDIVKAILQGRQPETLTAKSLSLDIKLAPNWTEQLKQIGMA